jgi:hypothetical protein
VRPPKLGPHRADVLTFCAATKGTVTSAATKRNERMIVVDSINERGICTGTSARLTTSFMFSSPRVDSSLIKIDPDLVHYNHRVQAPRPATIADGVANRSRSALNVSRGTFSCTCSSFGAATSAVWKLRLKASDMNKGLPFWIADKARCAWPQRRAH